MTGPETAQGAEPPANDDFDSIEERLAFAEYLLSIPEAIDVERDMTPIRDITLFPDDPLTAFPD